VTNQFEGLEAQANYRVIADCHVAGRSYSRGESIPATEIPERLYFLLSAGLIKQEEARVSVGAAN